MIYAKLAGIGSYLPEKILTNHDLEKMVETSHEWIVTRTGIETRHIAAENETTTDMAYEAAKRALDHAGMQATDLDMIVLATATPDTFFPSTACLLQEKLKLPGIPAFDVSSACSGFIYATSVANSFIRSGQCKNVMVVGAEKLSRILDWTDRNTCVLLGDGAGAIIWQASDEPGIHTTHLHADGKYKDLLYLGADLNRVLDKTASPYFTMNGREVFKIAVTEMANLVDEVLTANQLRIEDIDWLIPHQANGRIVSAVGKRVGIPEEKVISVVAHHGNTSAASVPLALDEMIQAGVIQKGQRVLMEAFGGGLTWGAALMTV